MIGMGTLHRLIDLAIPPRFSRLAVMSNGLVWGISYAKKQEWLTLEGVP